MMAQARPPCRQRRKTLARRMNSRTLRQRPARRYAVALIACLLTLLSAPSTAQPRLAMEPDTLFYSNQPGADNTLHLWNEGSDTLRIDSLRFSTFTTHGWGLHLVLSDSTYGLFYISGDLDTPTEFPPITLADDTLRMEFGLDPCPFCGHATTKSLASAVRDTLFIYSNDEQINPYPMPIDFARYVAVDQPDVPPPLSLEVYPNPSPHQATVRVVAERAGRYQVTLYNVLGQRVRREVLPFLPAGAHTHRLDVSSLPSGAYLLRLRRGAVQVTEPFVVVE